MNRTHPPPHRRVGRIVAVIAGLLASSGTAGAQNGDVNIEVPVLIIEEGTDVEGTDDALNLANMVLTAAKGVTTVQEAPAIVTVITGEEIIERGFANLEYVTDIVPGYLRIGALHSQFPFPATRGVIQSMMYMHNGVSMFDPMLNVPSLSRVQPLETIKRVELITGPGGVLWGANSLFGILNVITKDAEDVDGVESAVTVGHGNGDRQMMRGYVMAGIPELFSDSSKLFIHSSFETYAGPGFNMPLHMFSQPLPNPNSLALYGPLTQANPERSFLFNFDGKLTIGKVNLYFSAPLVERHLSLGFPGFLVDKDRPEDTLIICSDGSVAPPGGCPDGTTDTGQLACPRPEPGTPETEIFSLECLDPDRRARDNRADWYDRYLIADYRTRLADGKAGIAVKAYFVQFVRDFKQLGVLAPVAGLLEGGLAFSWNGTTYRSGGTFDGDVELPQNARLLYGVEGFHEWNTDDTDESRQGPGIQSRFQGPYDLARLPMACPLRRETDPDTGLPNLSGATQFVPQCPLTFAFMASRTVLGAYVNPQWKPTKKLTLDAGGRLQIAPESMGKIGYPLQQVFSGGMVYGFLENWHLKVNYAQGFRPPVFNNLISNGDGVQIGGDPDLEIETSAAYQGEVNARIFKGKRRIRELNFRVDYSYSTIQNIIQVQGGKYYNAGDRGMHSVEFLGKLYLRGGHRIELGYTWLNIDMADKGQHRAMPNHWFNLTGIFHLSEKIGATTNLRVVGAMEDPNRMVEYREHAFDEYGRVINTVTGNRETITVEPHEMTFDRLPPGGDLSLGFFYTPTSRLRLGAYAYNALNARYFQPDPFYDYEPRLEFLPNPYEDFYFRLNATYTY